MVSNVVMILIQNGVVVGNLLSLLAMRSKGIKITVMGDTEIKVTIIVDIKSSNGSGRYGN